MKRILNQENNIPFYLRKITKRADNTHSLSHRRGFVIDSFLQAAPHRRSYTCIQHSLFIFTAHTFFSFLVCPSLFFFLRLSLLFRVFYVYTYRYPISIFTYLRKILQTPGDEQHLRIRDADDLNDSCIMGSRDFVDLPTFSGAQCLWGCNLKTLQFPISSSSTRSGSSLREDHEDIGGRSWANCKCMTFSLCSAFRRN